MSQKSRNVFREIIKMDRKSHFANLLFEPSNIAINKKIQKFLDS